MTIIRFETCDLARALGFLKLFYPDAKVEDSGAVAEVLDFAAADVFRIPDPSLHPNGAIVPSNNWTEANFSDAVPALHRMDSELRSTESSQS